MKYLIGRKLGMTQRFLEDGKAVSVTAIAAGPCHVTQVKTKDKDGYVAVQLGFAERKKLKKPEAGHVKGLPSYAVLKEFACDAESAPTRGDELTVKQFVIGDAVDVMGTSKGKGFQGVVKRHGFKGSPATHGHKDQLRMPGSIGAGGVQRVFKGTRMGGHMGHEQVTIKDAKIVAISAEDNVLYVKGAIPGPSKGYVFLFSTSTTKPPKEEAPVAAETKVDEKKEAATDSKK